jgi:hypothetical protein
MGFAGRDQFAEMVGVAAGVVAPEVLIRHQSVMDGDTAEPGEDPELVHRLTATLGVGQIRGQAWGAGDVQAPILSFDPDAGLVEVCHRRCPQRLLDPLGELLEVGGDWGEDTGDPAGRHRQPQQVRQQLRGPCDRDVLVGQQIDRQRGHVRSVTRGRGRDLAAPAAPQPVQAMLSHRRTHRRQIHHLPPDDPRTVSTAQTRTTPRARRRCVVDDRVRIVDQ